MYKNMGALTIALLLTLGTAIMTAAISVGAYPSGLALQENEANI
jgi:hypothetical protein